MKTAHDCINSTLAFTLYILYIYIYTYFGEGGRGGSNKYIMPSIDRYWRAQPFSQNTRNLLINIGDQLTFLISNVYEQISRVLLLSRFWYIYIYEHSYYFCHIWFICSLSLKKWNDRPPTGWEIWGCNWTLRTWLLLSGETKAQFLLPPCGFAFIPNGIIKYN